MPEEIPNFLILLTMNFYFKNIIQKIIKAIYMYTKDAKVLKDSNLFFCDLPMIPKSTISGV